MSSAALVESASPPGEESSVLFVADGAAVCQPTKRALLGLRARFESVRLPEVAGRGDVQRFHVALFDCPASPAREVVSIAQAVADESVPVVLALFETDLQGAEARTFRAAHSVLVRPYRDAQLVASLRCAMSAATTAKVGLVGMAERFGLSPREAGILNALFAGERIPALARRLGLSAYAVRNQLKCLFRKCDVHSQEELLGLARRLTSGGG